MNIYWKNPVSDLFSNAADWSSGTVPGVSDIAKMTVAGSYEVLFDGTATVLGITTGTGTNVLVLGNSSFTATEGTATGANRGEISIFDGSTVVLGGAVDNIGTIGIETTGSPTILEFLPGATLEGGGEIITTTNSPHNEITGAFTNVDNTISGAVQISAEVHNRALGVIDASESSHELELEGPVTNAGLLEATGGGTLRIFANVTNAASGIIHCGAGSSVDLFAGTIRGGTLTADNTGEFFIGLAATLDGSNAVVPTNTMVTISGLTDIGQLDDLTLQGTIKNTGKIMMNASGVGSFLVVEAAGSRTNVTLEGHGSISLTDDPSNVITGEGFDAPVVTLINVNNDISGAGRIGGGNMALNNEAGGVIDATGTNPLIIDTGLNAVTNAGSLNADAGAELLIDSSLVNTGHLNSFGSTIIAAGKVTGTGTAIINFGGQVEFGAASTNGTKFATGSTGQLILDDSKQYTGTVSGFGANTTQSIDLTDINFATVTKSYTPASPNTSGTLTVKDGAGDVAHLKFSGTYTLANFHLADDGNGGVLITDPPVAKTTLTTGVDIALFGNYIASSLLGGSIGQGGSLSTDASALLSPPLLATPGHA